MKTKLNILLIEDSEADALLIMREIGKIGIDTSFERVDTANNLIAALDEKEWDIIISDYSMPGFDGITAVKMIRERDEDIPFIIVSGTIGEDVAVDAMKNGPNDYVLKNNLKRLNSAVLRELKDAEMKKERKLIRQQLSEKEQLYKTLVETSPDAILVLDSAGNILFANSQSAFLTGNADENELLGKNAFEFLEPEDRQAAVKNLSIAIKGNKLEQREFRLLRKDKSIVTAEISASLIPEAPGKLNRVLLVGRDITERKNAEDSLKLFRTLIDQSNDTIEVIEPATLRIIDINLKGCQVLGYTKEELLSMTVADFDTLANTSSFNKVGDELQKSGSSIIESIHKRKDGSTFPVEVNLRLIHHDRDYIVAISRDITERKQAEEKIIRLNRVYALLSNINKMIVRAKNIDGLYNDTCKIAVDIGQYNMVWIGIFNKNNNSIKPAAWEGNVGSYLEYFNVSINKSEHELIPMEEAVKKGHHVVYNNLLEDDCKCSTCFQAIQNNFNSIASFPLKDNDEVTGVISFYSDKINFFDEGEIKLLDELSSDISFSIFSIRQEHLRRKAEEELQKSESRFRSIVESSSDWIWEINASGNYIYVSPQIKELLGYSAEEIIGKSPFDLMLPSEAERLSKEIQKIFDERLAFKNLENINLHKNGSTVILETSAVPILDPEGNLTGYHGIDRDITERKKAEEALKESERHLRQILENVDAVFYMLSYKTGQVIYVNSAYERIWERPLAAVMENPEVWLDAVHPEDRKLVEDLFKQLSGETEYRIILPDGNIRWIWDRMFPVYDDKDEIVYICGMAADITERKNAVEKTKLLAHALQSINECITITDLDDNLTFVNNAFCKIYDYENNEVIGKHISIVRSKNNPEELTKEILSKTLSGGWKGELLNKRKNGEEFPVYLSTSAIYNEKGKPAGLLGVSADITERKKSEEKIIASELRFRSVWENSEDGMRLTKEDGTIIMVNNAFCKIVDLQKPELEGKPLSIIYEPKKTEHIIKQHIQRFQSRTVETHVEKKYILWNGKEIWLEIANSFLEFEKQPPLLLGIFRDISERKISEEKIIASELQFRSVWENSFDGMRLCDETGKIIRVNDAFCRLMNKSRDEIEGMPYNCIYDEKDDSPVEKFKNKFRTNSIKPKLETEISLWDKRKIWVELSNSFIEIKNKESLLLCIFRDITTRKNYETGLVEARNKAEEMNRLKTNFLNNMSHEMRTPLVAILGYAQFLLSEVQNKDQSEMLNGIISGGQRLLETINSILDLSRAESKKFDLKLTEVDLFKEAGSVIKRLSVLAEKKNLLLRLEKMEENVVSLIDVKFFTRIVENIVGNAIKYTKKGGITVVIDKNNLAGECWSVLKVIDTGIGIPKESLEIIFEEFRQASEGLNRQFEGSGLGLTITKKLVELLNGKITVESEPGKGSTFTVMFKTVIPSSHQEYDEKQIEIFEDSSRPVKPAAVKSVKYNLLVVDDDVFSRDIVRLFLKGLYKIEYAEKGEKAVQMAANKRYDAVLMDINLGIGMSGIEAAKQIREIEGYKGIPIIAVTAYAMEGDREKFLNNGCTGYISKPYEKKSLLSALNAAHCPA